MGKLAHLNGTEVLNFSVAGLVAFLVDVVVFYLLRENGLDLLPSVVISVVSSSFIGFVLNSKFTFPAGGSAKDPLKIIRKRSFFYLVFNLATTGIQFLILDFIGTASSLSSEAESAIRLVLLGVLTVTRFVCYKYFVFRT